MENWITRIVATLCAAGSLALFWTLGVFIAVPWHEGRMLKLNGMELQLIGVPLVIHNIGGGTREEDALFAHPLTGHFRWKV